MLELANSLGEELQPVSNRSYREVFELFLVVGCFDDYFCVAVPEGQDATLWRFDNCSGSRMLMTTPPYLAPSADDLLLPIEVVNADATR